MRAINHALTGALIGLVVVEPIAAVSISVISHFVMDAIPHHGEAVKNEQEKIKWIRSKTFQQLIIADAVLCGFVVLILADRHPVHWLIASICAFAAAAPDFLSINRYQKAVSKETWKSGLYTTFASRIQWFERPIGAVVEVVWFIACLVLLAPFLR